MWILLSCADVAQQTGYLLPVSYLIKSTIGRVIDLQMKKPFTAPDPVTAPDLVFGPGPVLGGE